MNGKVLLEGISDFWLRYFEDADVLVGAHEGALAEAGKSYQSMLMSLMRLSLKDAPLTETLPWQNILLYEHDIYPVGPEGFLWMLGPGVQAVDMLHNVVFSPTRVLERGFDFDVIEGSTERLRELRFYNPSVPRQGWGLLFTKDPFNWDSYGEACPGFAVTSTSTDLLRRVSSKQVSDWRDVGISAGDTLLIRNTSGGQCYCTVETLTEPYVDVTVRSYVPEGMFAGSLSAGTYGPNYDDILGREDRLDVTIGAVSTRVRAISAWAPYVDVDFGSLYDLYGMALSKNREPSTEEYRAFVQGVWNLYVSGPALSRIESAINVTCGYPVFRENDEEVYEITDTTVTTHVNNVLTSSKYVFPTGTPLRSDVVYSARVYKGVSRDGALTLFTDLTHLAETSFLESPIVAGESILYVENLDDGNAIVALGIAFVFDAYLQTEDAVDFAIGDWSVKNGATVVISGTHGAILPNTPVPKVFKAFDTFTTICAVTDYVEVPNWWETCTLPSALVPGLAKSRRVVSTETHLNTVNSSGDLARIGDYGLLVGQSDDGTVPITDGLRYLYDSSTAAGFSAYGVAPGQTVTVYDGEGGHVDRTISACGKYWLACDESESFDCGAFSTGGVFTQQENVEYHLEGMGSGETLSTGYLDFAPGSHHLLSWLLANDFLKWNMFSVAFDAQNAQFPRSQAFVLDLIMKSRPAHVFPYIASNAGISDNYTVFEDVSDSVVPKIKALLPDVSQGVENYLVVGGRDLQDFVDDYSGVDLSAQLSPGYFISTGASVYRVLDVSSYATPGYPVTGSMCVFSGSNTLIGVGTNFLRELPPGCSVVLGGDTYYVLPPVADDTYSDTLLYLDRAWEGASQVGLAGSVPAGYSNRVRTEYVSGSTRYGLGLAYQVLDENSELVLASAWGSGAVLGGVGAWRNATVGGMDPLIDRHELERTRVGVPGGVAEYVFSRHLVNGISVANSIPGCTISTEVDTMVVSDLPCIVRTINVA